MEREASVAETIRAGAERDVAERERRGEGAESAAHSPLQPNFLLTSSGPYAKGGYGGCNPPP